jgi:hypothetical protein
MTSLAVTPFDLKHGVLPPIQFEATVYEDFTFGIALRELEVAKSHAELELDHYARRYIPMEAALVEMREIIEAKELHLINLRAEIAKLKTL